MKLLEKKRKLNPQIKQFCHLDQFTLNWSHFHPCLSTKMSDNRDLGKLKQELQLLSEKISEIDLELEEYK